MAAKADKQRCVRVLVEGTVQGVGYRYWTERTATGLDLTGWVRNRRYGSVEALLCGDADAVAEMLQRCRDGPPSARVTAVRILQEGGDPPDAFEVLPTL